MEGKIAQSLASKVEKQFGKAERKEALMQSLGEHFVEKYLPNATWNPQILVSMFSGLTVCGGGGEGGEGGNLPMAIWNLQTSRSETSVLTVCVWGGGGGVHMPPKMTWNPQILLVRTLNV